MSENQFDLAALIADARRVIMDPVGFYRQMPKSGGYAKPVIFVVVMAAILGLLATVFSFFGMGRVGAMAVGIASIIFVPIFCVIGSFIGAAIVFVIWKLMGSAQSFETAYRCVAYSAAVLPIVGVLSFIPYIGSLLGIVWGMFLLATASIEVHGLKRETSYLVFGILGALLALSNLSGERASRRLASQGDRFQEQFERAFGGDADVTPEEAGRKVGEFLRGLEEEAKKKDDEN